MCVCVCVCVRERDVIKALRPWAKCHQLEPANAFAKPANILARVSDNRNSLIIRVDGEAECITSCTPTPPKQRTSSQSARHTRVLPSPRSFRSLFLLRRQQALPLPPPGDYVFGLTNVKAFDKT
jgi:hypothetical protein